MEAVNRLKVVYMRQGLPATLRRQVPRIQRLPRIPIRNGGALDPEDPVDLDWYVAWLSIKREDTPAIISRLIVHGNAVSKDAAYNTLHETITAYVCANRGFSIDDVIEHLHANHILEDTSDDAAFDAKRLLVFSILGWQSMVYSPAFHTCPASELAIHHGDNDPDSGFVFEAYTVPAHMCELPLSVFLKGFGNLLPARSGQTALAAVENSRKAASWSALYPSEMNAYLLHTLLCVRVRWVDTLALHLDYDKSSRTLSLFAFPSMCAAQLRARAEQGVGGGIFAFSSTEPKANAVDPRADEDDIAHFLEEVLLSFRLLFGQSAKSRRLFRHVFEEGSQPAQRPDTLLPYLCSGKRFETGGSGGLSKGRGTDTRWAPRDRSVYYAARDFPVLYERIELLASELKAARPKSVRDLLYDRRDTLQFWTFWLVVIVGGLSVGLGMIQVILQAVQIAQEAGKL